MIKKSCFVVCRKRRDEKWKRNFVWNVWKSENKSSKKKKSRNLFESWMNQKLTKTRGFLSVLFSAVYYVPIGPCLVSCIIGVQSSRKYWWGFQNVAQTAALNWWGFQDIKFIIKMHYNREKKWSNIFPKVMGSSLATTEEDRVQHSSCNIACQWTSAAYAQTKSLNLFALRNWYAINNLSSSRMKQTK